MLTRRTRLLAALLCVLAVPSPGWGAEITVQSDKVYEGDWAATLSLGSACADRRVLEVTGKVEGASFAACATVTSSATVVGPATLESGRRVALRSGFRVGSGARFTARITPTMYPDAFLTDSAPDSEKIYAVRLWLNTDDFTPEAGTSFDHLVAVDSEGDVEFRIVVLKRAEVEVHIEVVEDDGTSVSSSDRPLTLPVSGWHSVEVVWARSSGADDGRARLCVGTAACATLNGLDNDTGSIDAVYWGARGFQGGSAGSLHIDGFESFRRADLFD